MGKESNRGEARKKRWREQSEDVRSRSASPQKRQVVCTIHPVFSSMRKMERGPDAPFLKQMRGSPGRWSTLDHLRSTAATAAYSGMSSGKWHGPPRYNQARVQGFAMFSHAMFGENIPNAPAPL